MIECFNGTFFKMNYTIDINADLGEGFSYDDQIMPLISSCSIACGGHYGDENSMRKTIQLAKRHNVKVGAHPSFPDTENFGRKVMEIADEELLESLVKQMKFFYKICESENVILNHIKLHGALYNLASVEEKTAETVIKAFQKAQVNVPVYAPYNSMLFAKAKPYFYLKPECFIDRRYTDQGVLVNRTESGALIESPEKCFEQLIAIVTKEQVKTLSGKHISMKGETFCIHGDHQNVVDILKHIRSNSKNFSIEIA